MLPLRMLSFGLVALFALGCTAQSEAVSDDDASSLIGGSFLADGDLPSTLRIKGNCTAAKVGPRHILTAAHCVWRRGIVPPFADGGTIEVSAAVRQSESSAFQRLRIRHTSPSPDWVERCSAPTSQCEVTGADLANKPVDVALVETVEEIANIPIAAIDIEPLPPGEPVLIAGYGCQGSVGGYWSYASSSLKAGVVQLLPSSALLHHGASVTAEMLPAVASRVLVTPGPAWPTPGPGLCPGDSGGPLYRAKGGGATIVGVNASYSFVTRGSVGAGLPVTNWHTRLDTATPRNIGTWLHGLGATTCSGATCPTRAPASKLAGDPPAPALVADLLTDGRDVSCQRAALDTSRVQAAIDDLLDTSTYCVAFDGRRVAAGDGYRYAASVWCPLRTQPAAERVAAFAAAMEGRGFTYEGTGVSGRLVSPLCSSMPTGASACLATLPSAEKIAAEMKLASGLRSACTLTTDPWRVDEQDVMEVRFECTLEKALAPEYADHFARSTSRFPFRGVALDAKGTKVTGSAVSIRCEYFRPML